MLVVLSMCINTLSNNHAFTKTRTHCIFLFFGSTTQVIEKCLHRADRPTQALIIAELTNPTSIAQMLYDQYANYVVQRALSVADEEQGEF